MRSLRNSIRPMWLGLAAYLGTFLFIPLWDLFALGYSIFSGWQIRRSAAPDDEAAEERGLSVLLHPIRRIVFLLLAYAIVYYGATALKGVIEQPGPFGFVVTGVRNYSELGGEEACCDVSTVLASGRAVSDLLAGPVANTVRLLVGTSIAGLILITVLAAVALWMYRLSQRQATTGLVIYSLLKLAAARAMTVPAAGLALLWVLFLAIQLRWFPFGGTESFQPGVTASFGDIAAHLVLPSFSAALLPSLIAAQAGVRAWVDWDEHHPDDEGRWAVLGMESARTFMEQAGWILGGLAVVETIYAYPGIGSLILPAIVRQDAPVLIGILSLMPVWLLIARLRVTLLESAQQAFVAQAPEAQSAKRQKAATLRPRQIEWIWLGVAVVLLVFPLVTILRGAFQPEGAAREINMVGSRLDAYAERSDEHPLGTDAQGRDLQARIYEATGVSLGVAFNGGLIALTLGGGWGAAAVLVKLLRGRIGAPAGEALADLIRLPADAAILLHPLLIVIIFTISRYSTQFTTVQGQPLGMVGLAIGLALSPRVVWGVEALWSAAPADRSVQWRIGGMLAVILAASMFAVYQYSVAVDFLTFGVQEPVASLGNMLAYYRDILLGMSGVPADRVRYLTMALALSRATAVPAVALYVLQDALSDVFGFRRKVFVPRTFS